MFLLNGRPAGTIALTDRGLHYGDGLFETLEVAQGRPLFLDRHLARLERGCRKLSIPPPDRDILSHEAQTISAGTERAVLKLIITRGSGGRGYQQPAEIAPSRIAALYPFPDYPQHFSSAGVAVRLCEQRLAINKALAGIKHLNRLEQILARAEWRNDDYTEGLMLDYNGYVIEGSMSNVFMVKNGMLYTPLLSECGVEGIVRAIVMELAACRQIPVIVEQLDIAAFLQADEIFITNSVIGIWPVRQLEKYRLTVGAMTRMLQNLLNGMRAEGMKP
ncbi:MAG: aminodeoxychorismate lyase [Methylomonas sp.]|jgi:4-amino-4-deoxychorismate lyase